MTDSIILHNPTTSNISVSGDNGSPSWSITFRTSKTVNVSDFIGNSTLCTNVGNYIDTGKLTATRDGAALGSADLFALTIGDDVTTETETTAAVDLYVDGTNGSDTAGDGTLTSPFATITKAYNQVPYLIKHPVHIRYTADTYTSFPTTIHNYCDRDGQLTFECTGDPTTLAGEFTSTNISSVGLLSGYDITVTGASWTPDEFFGRFIKMTSGSGAGKTFPIYSNDTDTIKIPFTYASITTGDTFNVVDPSGVVNIDHAVTFDVDGTRDYTAAQFGIANTAFTTTQTKRYMWQGTSSAILCLCRFKTPSGTVTWYQSSGSINTISMLNGGFDDTNYGLGYIASLQLCDSLTAAPATSSEHVWVGPGKYSPNLGITLNCIACRSGVDCFSAHVRFGCCAVDHLIIRRASRVSYDRSRIDTDASYSTTDCIKIYDGAQLKCEYLYLDNAPRDYCFCKELGVLLLDMVGEAASATRYALNMGTLSRAILQPTSSISGTTADLRWIRSGATSALPATGNSATDTEGSWVAVD